MYDNCEAFIKICENRDECERKARAKLYEKPFVELDGRKPTSEIVKIILNYITEHNELSL